MRRSNRLVLLIGVFLAALVFVLVVSGIAGPPQGQIGASGTPGPVTVVVAAEDIPLGAQLKTEMLTTTKLNAGEVPSGALINPLLVVGKFAQNSIVKGAVLTEADINSPAAGLCQNIPVPSGKRAMAVQVDQVSGVGTVIRKGDFVDAILLIDFQVTTIDPATKNITVVQGIDGKSVKLLLQGMQVLCTLLPPAAPQPSTAPGASPNAGTALNGQQEIVIVALDPQQAEVMRFMQTGTPPAPITLILRSKQDFVDANGQPTTPPEIKTTGIVLKTLIDNYGVLKPEVIEAILPSPSTR